MNAVAATAHPSRNRILLAITALIALLAAGYATYWWLVLNHVESTDDAYVQGDVVEITPQVSGTVVAVSVRDTDVVKAGQVLVQLDPADATVALEQAKAQLAQAVREVRALYANDATLEADLAFRRADAQRLAAELERARQDLQRRQDLSVRGVLAREDLAHAQSNVSAAQSAHHAALAAVDEAERRLQGNRTLTEGVEVENHPTVRTAAARVHDAVLALERTRLLAPVSGQVAKRRVQLGQRLQPGDDLMAIVPLHHLWVDANFKEVQLRHMRVGQKATLSADMYGKAVRFHGTVVGLGAGTGAAFALLPAQNATGNWIKVVQRVPVRIALDDADLVKHPLRIGLSMLVEVDLSDDAPAPMPAASATARFDPGPQIEQRAQTLIREVIREHTGAAPARAPSTVAAH